MARKKIGKEESIPPLPMIVPGSMLIFEYHVRYPILWVTMDGSCSHEKRTTPSASGIFEKCVQLDDMLIGHDVENFFCFVRAVADFCGLEVEFFNETSGLWVKTRNPLLLNLPLSDKEQRWNRFGFQYARFLAKKAKGNSSLGRVKKRAMKIKEDREASSWRNWRRAMNSKKDPGFLNPGLHSPYNLYGGR
jgi:hypothetical protein